MKDKIFNVVSRHLIPFFLVCLLVFGIAGSSVAQPTQARPVIFVNPVGPPVATEGIRVSWSYEGAGVYWFVIEREEPYTSWTSEEFVGYIDDTSVQRGRTYRYRVCAVYESNRACDVQGDQGWVSGVVPTQTNPPTTPPTTAPTNPPVTFTPELTATPATGVQVNLMWNLPPSLSIRLSRVPLYRDQMVIYEALEPGNLDADYQDITRPNSTHRYKICFEGPDIGELCSNEVTAGPKPIAPTAPVNVRVERSFRPGGTTPSGIALRPRHFVSITWSNTAIPGVFLTVERYDKRTIRNPDPNSSIEFIRQSFWNEVNRLTAGTDPTSATVDDPEYAGSTVDPSLRAGNSYRVCAVVPTLSDAGKVCSQSVSLP